MSHRNRAKSIFAFCATLMRPILSVRLNGNRIFSIREKGARERLGRTDAGWMIKKN